MHPHNRTLTIITAALLLLALAVAPAAAFSGAGSGTQSDPYIITTPAQLQEMNNDLDGYFKLGNDIDLTGFSWTPIAGTVSSYYYTTGFSGTLDGNGYTISNLQFETTATGSNGIGCCFMVLNGGTIKNLKIREFTFLQNKVYGGANTYIPAVFNAYNMNNGQIINCDIQADTKAFSYLQSNGQYNYGTATILHTCDIYDSIISGSIDAGTGHSAQISTTGASILLGNHVEDVYVAVDISAGNEIYGIMQNRYGNFDISSSVFVGSTSKTANGRISNSISSATLSNNFVINTVLPSSTDANSYNGANVDAATLATQSFYQNTLGWDFANTWYWDSTTNTPQLQVFRTAVPPTISAVSVSPSVGGQQTAYTLSATATTEATGGISSYQWSYSTIAGTSWQTISGATTATYQWTPGNSIAGDVYFKVIVTGADGGTADSWEEGFTTVKTTVNAAPAISSVSTSRPLQKVNSPTTLTAIFADNQQATYQWYYQVAGGSWQAITGATEHTATWTPMVTGTLAVKIVATNQYSESSELQTSVTVLPTYTPVTIPETAVDISVPVDNTYQAQKQWTLTTDLYALEYYTPNLAYLAHGNAFYYLDSAEQEIISATNTTGNTIAAAYLGQNTGIITDTSGNTAVYVFAGNSWQYVEQNSASIIASTTQYAATISGGTLRIYNTNGNLIDSTTTTLQNLAGNDNADTFAGYSGKTITYYWVSGGEIQQATQTLTQTITDLHQIPGTDNYIINTDSNTITISISNTGVYTLLATSNTEDPLIHTQATNINVVIGVNAPNEIFIIGADGETDGTYVTGATLNDASIAKATGLYAMAGGEDRQAYILAKSTSSTWQLMQVVSFGDVVDRSQISTTGTFAAVATGLKLYLLEASDVETGTYMLQGAVIGSGGSPYAGKPISINGDSIRTDASGRFLYPVTPGTLYTIIADTTTTEYTASNAALQQIAIRLKPNPYAQSVSYSATYNKDTGNFEMLYEDTRDLTQSVTWTIRETGNTTAVYQVTVPAGTTATWPVPFDKTFTGYQITMDASRGSINVENVWMITPAGSQPINIPGLDDTGKNIIFGCVLMIISGLFGVMFSTKGAIFVVVTAGIMTFLGLLTIPWELIMFAGLLAVLAALAKGAGGS